MINKKTIRAHPITLFYLMRSYWFVFAAPIIRTTIQYLFFKKARQFVPVEAIALLFVICVAVVGWLFTKIIVTSDKLIVKKGFVFKKEEIIFFKKTFSISIRRNIVDILFGCVSCCVNTVSEKNKKKSFDIKLSANDANVLYKEVYGSIDGTNVEKQGKLRRFLTIPLLLVAAIFVLTLIKTKFFTNFDYYDLILTVFLLGFILYYGGVCLYNYKYGKLCIGDKIFAVGSVGLVPKTFCCSKNKVGIIKISQTPIDRRFKTCKIKITVSGESGDAIKTKNMKCESLVEAIDREFKFDIKV